MATRSRTSAGTTQPQREPANVPTTQRARSRKHGVQQETALVAEAIVDEVPQSRGRRPTKQQPKLAEEAQDRPMPPATASANENAKHSNNKRVKNAGKEASIANPAAGPANDQFELSKTISRNPGKKATPSVSSAAADSGLEAAAALSTPDLAKLDDLKMGDLKDIAVSAGIKPPRKATELIEAIRAHYNNLDLAIAPTSDLRGGNLSVSEEHALSRVAPELHEKEESHFCFLHKKKIPAGQIFARLVLRRGRPLVPDGTNLVPFVLLEKEYGHVIEPEADVNEEEEDNVLCGDCVEKNRIKAGRGQGPASESEELNEKQMSANETLEDIQPIVVNAGDPPEAAVPQEELAVLESSANQLKPADAGVVDSETADAPLVPAEHNPAVEQPYETSIGEETAPIFQNDEAVSKTFAAPAESCDFDMRFFIHTQEMEENVDADETAEAEMITVDCLAVPVTELDGNDQGFVPVTQQTADHLSQVLQATSSDISKEKPEVDSILLAMEIEKNLLELANQPLFGVESKEKEEADNSDKPVASAHDEASDQLSPDDEAVKETVLDGQDLPLAGLSSHYDAQASQNSASSSQASSYLPFPGDLDLHSFTLPNLLSPSHAGNQRMSVALASEAREPIKPSVEKMREVFKGKRYQDEGVAGFDNESTGNLGVAAARKQGRSRVAKTAPATPKKHGKDDIRLAMTPGGPTLRKLPGGTKSEVSPAKSPMSVSRSKKVKRDMEATNEEILPWDDSVDAKALSEEIDMSIAEDASTDAAAGMSAMVEAEQAPLALSGEPAPADMQEEEVQATTNPSITARADGGPQIGLSTPMKAAEKLGSTRSSPKSSSRAGKENALSMPKSVTKPTPGRLRNVHAAKIMSPLRGGMTMAPTSEEDTEAETF